MREGEMKEARARVEAGGRPENVAKLHESGKMLPRERLRLLLDGEPEFEDGLFARWDDEQWLPGDGVVTGVGKVGGRTVCFLANDFSVKAGTWGVQTIEKMIRILERARALRVPIILLIDSAAGRLDEQHLSFAGRRHAGRIFHEVVRNSGVIPQISLLFGPSPAGSAYLPALTDALVMVDGHATMYIGTPRMAEMVTGERVTYEELGGARMHCEVSGVGHKLVASEEEAISWARRWLGYLPDHWEEQPPQVEPRSARAGRPITEIVPEQHSRPFDMYELIEQLIDEDSWLELSELWAREVITGLARLEGQPLGVVANQPMVRGGVLFTDSADKVARFVWFCNAFNIPLLFLQDNSGFMVGTAEERKGIIRHGAKMAWAVSSATVPRISVVIRKAYGAGYFTMSGSGFLPDAVLALPNARIGVTGPEAAVNAMYFNTIQSLQGQERVNFVLEKRDEYARNLDAIHAASNMNIDAIVPGQELRGELARRFRAYSRHRDPHDYPARRNGVYPI